MLIKARINTQVLTRLSLCAFRKSVPLTRAPVTGSVGLDGTASAGAVGGGAGGDVSARPHGPPLGPLMQMPPMTWAGSAQADLRRGFDRGALGLGDTPEF